MATDRQAEGLWLRYCRSCKSYIYYPRDFCPSCLSDRVEWYQAKGTGTVYSFGIIRRNPLPTFNKLVPYIFAIVELDEGVRLMTNIVNCPLERVAIGMPVKIEPQETGVIGAEAAKRIVFSPLDYTSPGSQSIIDTETDIH